jgi:ketosteroid isomerase-like protein
MSHFPHALRCILLLSLFLSGSALADDADDVMAVLQEWASLENDLEAQAALIRDDRVQIFRLDRQSDQAANLKTQVAMEKARRSVDPDGYAIVTIESPEVRVYGDTAVASFVRRFAVVPGNAAPSGPPQLTMCTAVLVKERGGWKIAHLHVSS